MKQSQLRTGGVDNGGTMVAYPFEGREEVGWLYEHKDGLARVETFSGDYLVMHYTPVASLKVVTP